MVYEIYDYDGFKAAIDEICAELSHTIPSEKVFDCRLISCELIANVLQHSGGLVRLQVDVREDYVQISVKAERTYCPPEKAVCPGTSAERGRGIYLVDSLSAQRTFTEEGEIVVKVEL